MTARPIALGAKRPIERPHECLPPGCHVHLQRQAREQVLHSLRTLMGQSWRRLTTELQAYAALRQQRDVRLGEFLHDQQVDLHEIYRDARPSGWTTLRRNAGLLPPGGSSNDRSRRLRGRNEWGRFLL